MKGGNVKIKNINFSIVRQVIDDRKRNKLNSWPYYQSKFVDYSVTDKVSGNRTFSNKSKEIISEFNDFLFLIEKMGGIIKGETNLKKKFTLSITKKDKYEERALTELRIFNSKDEYYSESVGISHLFYYGIISYINKIQNIISKQNFISSSKTEQSIAINGKVDNKKYIIDCTITRTGGSKSAWYNNNGWVTVSSNFKYLDEDKTSNNCISYEIPEHVPESQQFRFLFTTFTNHNVMLDKVEGFYKKTKVMCCGSKLESNYKFCPLCGETPILPEITVDDITNTDRFTVLTKR
tara:strand:- start:320 stop:1198 length:879 start_codon:yes stop_codon:yes gene_type:complete